jgi:hypothetical protein
MEQPPDLHLATTTVLTQLPADITARALSFLWSRAICRAATTCRTLYHVLLLTAHHDALLFRKEMLACYPSIVLSAMEAARPVSGGGARTWRGLLRSAQLTRMEWLASEQSDRTALKEPSKSRSLYCIRIEAGLKRFIRIGGHYFFKVAFRALDSHQLDGKTGMITAAKWVTPRIRGMLKPVPLRGFTFTSLPWDTPKRLLSHPAAVLFGGAETAYPFDEQNQLWVLLPVCHRSSKHGPAVTTTTSWVWVKPSDVGGTAPSPRRGMSASPSFAHNSVIYFGGGRTSPCSNFSDVHVLSLPSQQQRSRCFRAMAESFESADGGGGSGGGGGGGGGGAGSSKTEAGCCGNVLDGFTWSVVRLANDTIIPPPRFSHMASLRKHEATEKGGDVACERVIVYGGSQLGGKTALFDAYELCVTRCGDAEYECEWRQPLIRGEIPHMNRTGPATFFVGRKMLLIGGHTRRPGGGGDAAAKTEEHDVDQQQASALERIRVLAFDCGSRKAAPRWYEVQADGETAPAERMGVGLTLKGDVLLMSGGYERDGLEARGKLLNKTDSWRLRFVA